MKATCDDDTFISTWLRHEGYAPAISKELGINLRSAFKRRATIEQRRQIVLPSGSRRDDVARSREYVEKLGHRITLTIKDGTAIIFGDAHYWPGEKPVAHEALLRVIKLLKPAAIICNGDAFDGAAISRHPPTSWAQMPDVADELAYCQQMIGEIEQAAAPKTKLIWCMGNHDTRFSARLAQSAPQYVRVHGTDLPDHFPAWNFSWSCQINEDVMVKHRFRGGVHATWNNSLHAGMSIFTNHLHRLCITPVTDYRGRRYGVDCGTLSDFGPTTPKFTYGEDNPFQWGSGFAVATFRAGRLLPPELVMVQDGVAYFRGQPVGTMKAAA